MSPEPFIRHPGNGHSRPPEARVQQLAIYGTDGRLRRTLAVNADGQIDGPVLLSRDELAYAVVSLPGGGRALTLAARGPRPRQPAQRTLRARLQRAWDAYMGRAL